jgi:hypothetical protein
MTDEQYDAELARLRARAGPAQGPPRLGTRSMADLAWVVIHATKKEVSVIQGDVRGTAHLG